MDASMDPFEVDNMETYVIEDTSTSESCNALLEFATTSTILWDKQFLPDFLMKLI